MLYVTTRSEAETYTAQYALNDRRGPDGGFFVPHAMPRFSQEEIGALGEKSFSQWVADVLNRLFPVHLSAWDVSFCIGRNPVRLRSLGHRCSFVESWHNPQWDYGYLIQRLSLTMGRDSEAAGDWAQIAIRIAILFGVFSDLKREGILSADVAFLSGDFTGPISAWYARQWGLPIGNILCCCNENQELWNLICHGELRTDGLSTATKIPEADVSVPKALERLVYSCGGVQEVQRYLDACRSGRNYLPGNAALENMRKGLYVSVVGTQRAMAAISQICSTHGHVLTPQAALAYSGLMDYRAKTGVMRHALVMEDQSPRINIDLIAKATGISEKELEKRL